jgi:nucleolar protein 4
MKQPTKSTKSTENTVFVRFVPAPAKVMRHELEELFSQMGPIKKSSWIHAAAGSSKAKGDQGVEQNSSFNSKGYGFVKYVSPEDAQAATKELHNSNIQMNGQSVQLKVELASETSSAPQKKEQQNQQQQKKKEDKEDQVQHHDDDQTLTSATTAESALSESKKKSRIILRNLSFYAKEAHIRKSMEQQFGKVIDIHVPRVKDNLHVGFCFVTFEQPKDAEKAVHAKTIDIQKRSVNMDWSVPKRMHQQQKQMSNVDKEKEGKGKKSNQEDGDEKDSDVESENSSDKEEDEKDQKNYEDKSSDEDNDSDDDDEKSEHEPESKASDDEQIDHGEVDQKKTLFLRNLPFDTTRHDLFQMFCKFGHIKGIYLVKDRDTGVAKGTAFVTYSKPESAQRAMVSSSSTSTEDAATGANASSFLSQRQASGSSSGSLLFRDRRIMVDLAVDKETAATFDSKAHTAVSTDRRNMYLQSEARVESTDATNPQSNNNAGYGTWDDLPQQDQRKRQHALKDKTTKLQSPLFFINPNRLSFRNVAKHVDESMLRKLCVDASKRGLQKGLVSAKDQIANWRAPGEMSTRDILSKVQEMESNNEEVVTPWREDVNVNNSKEYLPSVYIDRDFVKGKKADAPSRGFGFVEFTHHVHALACLRELNNNPSYSTEYAAGGTVAAALKKKKGGKATKGGGGNGYIGEDGRVQTPRLIVDFTVRISIGVLSVMSS